MRELSEDELQRLHRVLLKMLCEFDEICRRNQIQYFLGGGTLLGAVRHQGFIPWDDDLDLMMFREDYERLCRLPKSEFPKHLFLQTVRTDPFYHGDMAKLRLNGTVYSTEFSCRFPEMHQGIFLDIFVHDRTAKSKIGQRLHIFFTLLTRSFVFHKWAGTPMQDYGKYALLCRIFTKLNSCLPMGIWQWFRERCYSLFSNSGSQYLYDGMGQHLRHGCFPAQWLENTVFVKFEGMQFPAPSRYNEYLQFSYGDYMVMPHPQNRRRHKIAELNFGGYE